MASKRRARSFGSFYLSFSFCFCTSNFFVLCVFYNLSIPFISVIFNVFILRFCLNLVKQYYYFSFVVYFYLYLSSPFLPQFFPIAFLCVPLYIFSVFLLYYFLLWIILSTFVFLLRLSFCFILGQLLCLFSVLAFALRARVRSHNGHF